MPNNEEQVRHVERLIRAGRIDAARQACAVLIGDEQSDSYVWRLAADVAMRSRATTEALQCMTRALACDPGNPELLIQLGQYLLGSGQRTEARVAALEAAGTKIGRSDLLDALGTLLTHCGEAECALARFEQAVLASPQETGFRYNLAMAQRMAGELEAAEANLDIVLAATPFDGEAQNARSGLRTQTPDRNHVAELQSTLARLNGGRGSVGVEFALAKELEDLGDFERSFSHLASACRRVRGSVRYDVSGDVAVLDALKREHTAERLAQLTSSIDDDRCIFIIGLPRSGTTLVERILGSHGRVHSGGELEAFPKAVIESATGREGPPVGKLELVERTLKLDFNEVGARYLQAVRESIGCAARFTDKLPLNYLYAGLIHAALPRAKFVAIRRNPMDVCYAMYKTLFASAYPFTYDLLDLARYYVSWDRLMRHWGQTIGSAWFTLQYEDLITDQEEYSRRLVSHCGLEWDSACLDFHKHLRAVVTASAAQVRRPLYSDSVGRWRVYEKQLEPLIRYLESHGIACRG